MKTTTCDRCGNVIREYDEFETVTAVYENVQLITKIAGGDLCVYCRRKLLRTLKEWMDEGICEEEADQTEASSEEFIDNPEALVFS